MAKQKTKVVYVLSKHLRGGNKKQREALLEWMVQPRFKYRRPSPKELVRECKRLKSPLYGLIEVDQKRAAEKYWREAAQYILRHVNVVRVVIKTGKVITQPVVAYIPIRVERGGRIPEENYIPAQRVASNPKLKRAVCVRAHQDFQAWMQRYERYDEFMEEFSPILAAYKDLRRRLGDAA